MLNLLQKLLDPKVQIFIVGLLSVLSGVAEYLAGNDFIAGYPEILGAVVAVNGVLLAILKVARMLVVAPIKRKLAAKSKVRDGDFNYLRDASHDEPYRGERPDPTPINYAD